MTKTNQTRAIEVATDLWESFSADPTCRYDHIDDFIIDLSKMVRENDEANYTCSSSHLFQQHLTLRITLAGDLVYSIERTGKLTLHWLYFTQALSSDEMGAFILDHWSSDDRNT